MMLADSSADTRYRLLDEILRCRIRYTITKRHKTCILRIEHDSCSAMFFRKTNETCQNPP